jgi:hypothetical protein
MSLQKYLNIIKDVDAEKIYVENVRSIYNIPRLEARLLCEMAVTDNIFIKKIGLICPAPSCHSRIIAEYNSYADIPEEITCHICEAEDVEPYTYKTSGLKKIEFYQLKKDNG